MKKTIAIILSVCLVLVSIPLLFAAANEPLNYLVLGDSIAQGSGITNRKEAVYGKVVADTNGYEYTNYAHDGYRTTDLLAKLSTDKYLTAVRKADVISLSIGGNNFMQEKLRIPALVAEAAVGDYRNIEALENTLYNEFSDIMDILHEENPDVVILMQTLYNTHSGALGAIYDIAIPRVNRVITTYLESHPGAYIIVDVAAKFEGHPEYVAADTIHPSALGNVALAECVLETLYELGLGENTVPVVNVEGKDELPNWSQVLKRFFDIFRSIMKMFGK